MKEKKKEYREEIIEIINQIDDEEVLNYIRVFVNDIKQEVQYDE